MKLQRDGEKQKSVLTDLLLVSGRRATRLDSQEWFNKEKCAHRYKPDWDNHNRNGAARWQDELTSPSYRNPTQSQGPSVASNDQAGQVKYS